MIITIIRDFLDFSFRVVYIYDCVRFWTQCAVLAQSVARRLGKAEVGGSSPLDSFELFPGIARECGVSGVFLLRKFQKGAKSGQTIKFSILSTAHFVCFPTSA